MDGKRKVGNIFGGISLGAFAVNILTLLFVVIGIIITRSKLTVSAFIVTIAEVAFFICLCRAI